MDTGDLLFSRESLRQPNARQIGKLKADLYMKAYNRMGYDAFMPGELDFSLGVTELNKMSQQANFPFLAANLIAVKSNKRIFKAYTIKEIGGMKVGILGLISDRFSLGGPPEEKGEYQITDPVEAAEKAVAALKKRCRLIVALTHMEADEQKILVEKVRGIHFIINGHLSHSQSTPQFVSRTQILIAGARGENIGGVDLSRKRARLYSRYQLVPMKADYHDHPEVQALVAQYKKEFECAMESPVSAEVKSPPDSVTEVPQLLSFLGNKGCETCHPREQEHWATTPHARAYQTLVEKNKTSDSFCLSCHTTGFRSHRQPAVNYENVQCEACHGPAEGHPDPRKELEDAEEQECRACHNPTNSPNFNYQTYLQKIIHPK